MNSRTEGYPYTIPEENLRRLIIVSEFLLFRNLEEEFLIYLRELRNDSSFTDFEPTILDLIEEYDIDVEAHLKAMIPVM